MMPHRRPRQYADAVKQRWLRRVVDAVFAGALAAVAVVEIWVPLDSAFGSGSPTLSTVVAVILCLALAVRRSWPLATALVVLLTWPIVFSIQPILLLFWGQLVPMAVATYSVARYGSWRAGLIGAGAGAACLLFFDTQVMEMQEPGEIFFHWMVLILAWTIGQVVRKAERRAAESHRRATEIEVQARTVTLTAIAEERARIARELHDIVAHSVSMMVVQAGAAEQVADDDPEYTRRALATIRTTGADALAEMRRLVSMLREQDGAGELHPQPGIDGLSALVEDARSGGLTVGLRVEGEPRMLPTGLDLAAYRIVQEALTNVRRHAAAERADVLVRFADESLHLEVRDDGVGAATATATVSAGGHGLIGMRERAALYGGRLETISGSGSGFLVRAVLPLEPAAS